MPTRALAGQTPYEAWTGVKPNVSHIRVFGCLTHMKVPDVHTRKLDDRSIQVVNLGREPGTKGYRVYDPVSEKIHVSRDVVFEEAKVWPWEQRTGDCGESDSVLSVPMPTYDVQPDGEQGAETEVVGSEIAAQQGDEEINPKNYDETPRKYRSVTEIYDVTEEVELENELMLMSIDEPGNFNQAAAIKEWRVAMQNEIDSIEKNGT